MPDEANPRKGGYMVSEWQFAAVAAYLLWCLLSTLAGLVRPDRANAETRAENNDGFTALWYSGDAR